MCPNPTVVTSIHMVSIYYQYTMFTDENFKEAQLRYFGSGEQYEETHNHYEKAKLLLVGLERVEEVHEELRDRHNDERHWYQQKFITKSINSILSAYLLTQNHFYDSAYRDVRSLFETFLLINHMNDNKIKTARVFLQQERDLWKMDIPHSKMTWERLHSENELHKMIKKERNRLEEMEDDYGRLYDFFSNRNIHPTRIDGVDVDQNYAVEEERQLLNWLMDMVLGLVTQLAKLYADTPDFDYVKDNLFEVVDEIEEVHNYQSFLEIAMKEFPGVDD